MSKSKEKKKPTIVMVLYNMELTCSDEKEKGNILSWPPRSSTAWTKRAWRELVHRIRGARMLLFPTNRFRISATAAAGSCRYRWCCRSSIWAAADFLPSSGENQLAAGANL